MTARTSRRGAPRPDKALMGRVLRRLGRLYDYTRFVRTNGPDPFRILVGCVISLRTKDEVTYPATERLFRRASTPQRMLRMREATIAKLIYPAGFYRRKATQIRAICRTLVDRHDGRVPDEMESLLELSGVGRKTANLVLTLGFDKPGICVDVHVHRISNRLRWVRTAHPDETEQALRVVLPRRYWTPINEILVRHGQQVCKPVSPVCSACSVEQDCPKQDVIRSR
jgi:endonuclease-3